MTQLDMIEDAIAKLEATVEDAQPSLADHNYSADVKAKPNRPAATKANPHKPKSSKPQRSKKAVLQLLVERKSSATMSAMIEATGWQAHSVRAGLTGLRKAGVDLERRTNRKGETFYVVAQTAAAQ